MRAAAYVVLGAGLAGLAAARTLARAGHSVLTLESAAGPGGLARTIARDGFRFDLGGHRFHTADARVDALVRELLGPELLRVHRTSRILLRGKYFDYPLRPLNAVRGLGAAAALAAVVDYGRSRFLQRGRARPVVSLEDWVVKQFGRRLFEMFFRDYSEKVWGLGCREISAEWVARRIQGLSLGQAIRGALLPFTRPRLPTLTDEFAYPRLGIGQIAERLREEIEAAQGIVATRARVVRVARNGRRVRGVTVRHAGGEAFLRGAQFISSIPLSVLVRLLDPPPPEAVCAAAACLGWRSLVLVMVQLDVPRVTSDRWIYFPGRDAPFSRLHEPTNWSPAMAPPGRTSLVTEYFCSRADSTWCASDETLAANTVQHLARLCLIRPADVIGWQVVRVPHAYPLFSVGYERNSGVIREYLSAFENLQLAGRGGMFEYYNMDHAIASGLEAAEAALAGAATAPVALLRTGTDA